MKFADIERITKLCGGRWNHTLPQAPHQTALVTSFDQPFVLWAVRLLGCSQFEARQIPFDESLWRELNDALTAGELEPLGAQVGEYRGHAVTVRGYIKSPGFGEYKWRVSVDGEGLLEADDISVREATGDQ